MCGRAVQRSAAVLNAATILGCHPNSFSSLQVEGSTRMNMSPGNTFTVLQKDTKSVSNANDYLRTKSEINNNDKKAEFCTREKVWGLITRKGTSSSPLPKGASKHFSNLMFNARSETAAEKPSFRNLISSAKSCILPLDGYYEWKTPSKDTIGNNNKQPYYVHRSDGLPLFVAGLYTEVSTGYPEQNELHTFTMLTTSACPQLKWLHHRMPVLLWDENLIKKWISSPSSQLLEEVASLSNNTGHHPNLAWHPVTKKMSNVQYDGMDSIAPIKLQKLPSITSFFGNNSSPSASMKRDDHIHNNSIAIKIKDPHGIKVKKQEFSKKKSTLFSTQSPPPKAKGKRANFTNQLSSWNETLSKKPKLHSLNNIDTAKKAHSDSSSPSSSNSINMKSSTKPKAKRDITSYFRKR